MIKNKKCIVKTMCKTCNYDEIKTHVPSLATTCRTAYRCYKSDGVEKVQYIL